MESSKVPALTRAIEILDLIGEIGPCKVQTIVQNLNIPKSTLYLIISELKKNHLIRIDNQNNYCLWTKIVEWSEYALNQLDLRDIAKKPLTELMKKTGLLCHLGIIDNNTAYYILKIESSSTISVRSHEGKSLSLYRSGIGKCLLAWQEEKNKKRIIDSLDFHISTNTTIGTKEKLIEELSKIINRGWSYDNGEDYPDVRCVAVPIFNSKKVLIAAISVVGTSLQIDETNREKIAQQAIFCSKQISEFLKI